MFIYGKITFLNKNKKNVRIIKINSTKVQDCFSRKYFISIIKNGRIYTDNVSNVAIIDKNNLINIGSYQQINGKLENIKFNICKKIGTPRIKKKFTGQIFSFAQGASGHNNYSHWLLDILPKINIYNQKFDISKVDYFYLNKLNKFQKESLKLLKLKHIKIIDSNIYRHIEANKIISTSHPWYKKGYILKEQKYIPKWIVFWLRKNLLINIKKKNSVDKIFIDRSDSNSNHCQLINNSEVKKFFLNRGFKIVKLAKFSFKEQIKLFYNSKIIVGPHGAGLTNLVFCRKNSKVIEIRPKNHPNDVYKRICSINKLKYKLFKTPTNVKTANGDIYVDLEKLKQLKKFLNF